MPSTSMEINELILFIILQVSNYKHVNVNCREEGGGHISAEVIKKNNFNVLVYNIRKIS